MIQPTSIKLEPLVIRGQLQSLKMFDDFGKDQKLLELIRHIHIHMHRNNPCIYTIFIIYYEMI